MAEAITTAAQLWEAGDIGRCELIRGELVMMIPPGGEHGWLTVNIAAELRAFAAPRDMGTVLAETGFVLARDPDTVRAPDVAFLRAGRPIGRGYLEGAPDLAVEVRSPNDQPREIREKTAEWLAAGAQQVWNVDPDARTVTIHRPDAAPRTLGEDDTLNGGTLLPGFALRVRRFWE